MQALRDAQRGGVACWSGAMTEHGAKRTVYVRSRSPIEHRQGRHLITAANLTMLSGTTAR